jgi:uncharacterized LabA/DUF88 family protein
MKVNRKFVMLIDVDNALLDYEGFTAILKQVEALGSVNYIKLYGMNDKRSREFADVIQGRCCDTAPILRQKAKSRKSFMDTRIIVDAVKISDSGIADSFAIVAGEGDYGYLLSALKAANRFIAGKFKNDVNVSFCDVYLGEFEPDFEQIIPG